MTAKDVLKLARVYAGDDATNQASQFRKDDWFIVPLNAALNRLKNRVPSSRIASDGVTLITSYPDFDGTDWDGALWPTGHFRETLAHYLAFIFFTHDAGDTRDGMRAKAHREACSPLAD